MENKHKGSSFDSFLEAGGLFSQAENIARERVLNYKTQKGLINANGSNFK